VSAFDLDVYEITVARFRAFVAGYPKNRPTPGAGKNAHNPTDPGWSSAWDAKLPATRDALVQAIRCNPENQTWTDIAGANESKPMNCISWYEAFAFCISEGKRLPTEAEWNFAAAAGSEQRYYPFSSPAQSPLIEPRIATYARTPLGIVGSKPAGNGKWGHSDLTGNVSEWVLDKFMDPYGINPCDDCADLPTGEVMTARGGSFVATNIFELVSSARIPVREERSFTIGARCAK
jgi:formylglycine-generating enzyme